MSEYEKATYLSFLALMESDKNTIIKEIDSFSSNSQNNSQNILEFMTNKKVEFEDKYFLTKPKELKESLYGNLFSCNAWIFYAEIIKHCADILKPKI